MEKVAERDRERERERERDNDRGREGGMGDFDSRNSPMQCLSTELLSVFLMDIQHQWKKQHTCYRFFIHSWCVY